MPNLMTNIFIGYVEEIIYKEGRPTLELRVRVPSIHGTNTSSGLRKQDLPIAKPIFMPGSVYRTQALEEAIQSVNKVFVMFESGDQSKPVYFGVKGNEELYEIPSDRPDTSTVTRENKTFVGTTDPSLSENVINGDLWFDTTEDIEEPEGEPEEEPDTLENPGSGTDGLDVEGTI